MALTKYKLGDLIQTVDERNLIGIKKFYGVNINKEFMPTVANTSTLDERKYKVVRKNRFACNLMHVGRDVAIPLALFREDEPIIVSPAYFTFEISAKDKILPEYLFMFFQSKEKDRLGWFLSDSSIRANLELKTFCDIEIELPPLEVQKKFVAVYNSMLANQKIFERGLDDLKLVCDGYIKKFPVEKIGNYIELSDERNSENIFTVDSVRGISIEKNFIKTKADMTDVSLTNYFLVKPDYFAFNKNTSRNGDKISIAKNNSDEIFICSTSYAVFYTNAKKLFPKYLMLWLSRKEFDRYARFNSWGSAREIFSFAEMCDVEIPIPDIKIQKSIAAIYEVYQARKNFAEQLKLQIKNICPILIKGSQDEGKIC